MYVDLTKDSYKSISAFANWFARQDCNDPGLVKFTPLENVFTVGYISMENYLCTIPDTNPVEIESASFAIPANKSIQV